jgi:hypothetical protein
MSRISARFRRCLPILLLPFFSSLLPAQSSQPVRHGPLRDHITLEEGGGGTLVKGSSEQTPRPGFNFVAGLGYSFAPNLALLVRFTLNQQLITRTVLAQAQQVQGHYNIPAFTFQPLYRIARIGRLGAYVTAGGGISIKQIRFTDPVNTDADGNPLIISSVSTTQPVVVAGAGLYLFPLRKSTAALYVEGDFQHSFTPATTYPGLGTDGTSLIPITLGIRF